MKQHLFLTGEKGIGKSTLIQTWLSQYQGQVGGFLTCKQMGIQEGKVSVHLLTLGQDMVPSIHNLLFLCGEQNHQETIKRFHTVGCQALEFKTKPDLIIMDELGPHEESAVYFTKKVMSILDGSIPVLGVVQKAASNFLLHVATHPKVKIQEVTVENRNQLAHQTIDHIINQ